MSAAVKGILAIVIVAVVAIGSYAAFHKSNTSSKTNNTAATSAGTQATTSQPNSVSKEALSSTDTNPAFTINARDDSADHEAISVVKGANVSLTFKVETNGVYHGGLQFKSTDPAIDRGPIAPGDSKTVTFTASKSFSFQPYWYASQIKKDYLIQVNVQ